MRTEIDLRSIQLRSILVWTAPKWRTEIDLRSIQLRSILVCPIEQLVGTKLFAVNNTAGPYTCHNKLKHSYNAFLITRKASPSNLYALLHSELYFEYNFSECSVNFNSVFSLYKIFAEASNYSSTNHGQLIWCTSACVALNKFPINYWINSQ